MNIKILWPIHVWHAFTPPWCCLVMSMLLITYYLCKMSMLLKTIIYISFISFQVFEVCKNFFITQNCFSITSKCKEARSPTLAFVVATSIYTNSLFKHITKIYHIEWRNGSSFQNTAFHNLFGVGHVLIVLNLNSSKALKMLPIDTMDLLYVIESAFQTRKTIGHVQVLYLLSMLHRDGISIHQTVQSLAMVSFSAMDGSKELVIFRASSNDPKSQSCSV